MGNSYRSHAQTCPWWTEASKARAVVAILIKLALFPGPFVVVAWFPWSFVVVALFPGSFEVVALFPGSLVVVSMVSGSSETIEISSDFNFTQYIIISWRKRQLVEKADRRQNRDKRNLNNTCNHLHFLSCHVRGDCPPFLFRFCIGFSITGETSVLCTRKQVKKKKKLLECDRVFSVTIFVGDTLPPSRTRQFLGAFNWNAENTMIRELWDMLSENGQKEEWTSIGKTANQVVPGIPCLHLKVQLLSTSLQTVIYGARSYVVVVD